MSGLLLNYDKHFTILTIPYIAVHMFHQVLCCDDMNMPHLSNDEWAVGILSKHWSIIIEILYIHQYFLVSL